MINKVILVGEIAGSLVTTAVDGRPCCRFTIQVEERTADGRWIRLLIPVQVDSQHATWTARWIRVGQVVCVDGRLTSCREPADHDPPRRRLLVLPWQVKPLCGHSSIGEEAPGS